MIFKRLIVLMATVLCVSWYTALDQPSKHALSNQETIEQYKRAGYKPLQPSEFRAPGIPWKIRDRKLKKKWW